jgi:hypothetical protein
MSGENRIVRKLMVLAGAFGTLVLAGCCQYCNLPEADRDIVYAFDIPTSQADCPAGTTFMDVSENTGSEDLGGSGIVDRGGSGIVDRNGQQVQQFCYEACPTGENTIGPDVYTDWNNSSNFIVAKSKCELPDE